MIMLLQKYIKILINLHQRISHSGYYSPKFVSLILVETISDSRPTFIFMFLNNIIPPIIN